MWNLYKLWSFFILVGGEHFAEDRWRVCVARVDLHLISVSQTICGLLEGRKSQHLTKKTSKTKQTDYKRCTLSNHKSPGANIQSVLRGCCPKGTISTARNMETHRDGRKSAIPSVRGTVTNTFRGWEKPSSSARSQRRASLYMSQGLEQRQRNSEMRIHGKHTLSGRVDVRSC